MCHEVRTVGTIPTYTSHRMRIKKRLPMSGATFDWNDEFESARRRVTELEEMVSGLREALERKADNAAATEQVRDISQRTLSVRMASLERARFHQRFIEHKIQTGATAVKSLPYMELAHVCFSAAQWMPKSEAAESVRALAATFYTFEGAPHARGHQGQTGALPNTFRTILRRQMGSISPKRSCEFPMRSFGVPSSPAGDHTAAGSPKSSRQSHNLISSAMAIRMTSSQNGRTSCTSSGANRALACSKARSRAPSGTPLASTIARRFPMSRSAFSRNSPASTAAAASSTALPAAGRR